MRNDGMTAGGGLPGDRAARLREAFDRSFAQPPTPPPAPGDALLAISVGSDAFAVRLTEISGLLAGKKVVRVPGALPEFVGLAGYRGGVLPTYDLAMLLGGARAAAPRWLAIARAAPLALAFDGFVGYFNVPTAALVPEGRAEDGARHVREVVRTPDGVRPLISVASLIERVRDRAARSRGKGATGG